jgi:AcrR family transcriptional regulator
MASQPMRRRHDAARAHAAILEAAAQAFAAHGFAATSMQQIAASAGYDKSLLFQYFGDKVGLYTATIESVVRQAVPGAAATQVTVLVGDPDTPRNAHKLATLVATIVRGNFDALWNHAVARRLLAWEAAEEWHTFGQVYQRYAGPAGAGPGLVPLLRAAQESGLVHRDLDIAVLLTLVQELPRLYLTELPRLSLALNDQQLVDDPALARARDQLLRAVVRAVMSQPGENTGSPEFRSDAPPSADRAG